MGQVLHGGATTTAAFRRALQHSQESLRALARRYGIAEVQTAEGKLYLFVAIDQTSKFAFARLFPKAGKVIAAEFLRDLIAAVPYAIHTVLTDKVSSSPTGPPTTTHSTTSSIASVTRMASSIA